MNIEKVVHDTLFSEGIICKLPVVVNNRLSTTLARVVYINNAIDRIEFNSKLLSKGSDEEIQDIVKHECAHVIAFYRTGHRQGHNEYFQKICKQIGCECGEKTRHTSIKARYEFTCPICNKVVCTRERKGKVFDGLIAGRYHCRMCGTNSEKFILTVNG